VESQTGNFSELSTVTLLKKSVTGPCIRLVRHEVMFLNHEIKIFLLKLKIKKK